MNRLSNFIALIFAVMLSYISIHTVDYGLYLSSQVHQERSDSPASVFSSEKPGLLFLNRQEGRFVRAIKNLPVTHLKTPLINFYSTKLSTGLRVLKINREYLTYPVTVYRNLKNSDIVFPFHYFW
jgi:hypothetical protein